MKSKVILPILLFTVSIFLFTGCDYGENNKFELSNSDNKTYLLNNQNGDIYYVDNKTMYKVVAETSDQNRIGQILDLNAEFDYTKAYIKTKIYNDRIYYEMALTYNPKIINIPDQNDSTKKIKTDVSKVKFDEWKRTIINQNINYNITLVFVDKDDFTIATKVIYLKNISVNNSNGMTYEGSFRLDKSLTTKINTLSYYYNFPKFNKQ